MKRNIFVSTFLIFLMFFISLPAESNAAKKSSGKKSAATATGDSEIGISGGLWMSGTMSVWDDGWDVDVDKSSSLMLRAILDKYVGNDFAVGLYINFSQIEAEDADIDGTMKEFGFAFKPKFYMSPTLAVKPGLNIGYRLITSSDIEDIEGLGVNFSCEFQFLNNKKPAFYIDLGFLAQPTGGNDYYNLTFGPIFYILAGVFF